MTVMPNSNPSTMTAKRGVLINTSFGKLWRAMAFSSFGDWLGLLATTALAQQLSGGDYAKANFAIAGVFIVRLLPAVILGPIAGVIADRFDRRRLMIICDILRFALYFSIPIIGNYFWLYAASILVETVTLFWSPAKEATIPNIVPKEKLENANQASLFAAYGTAPLAAATFSLLALISGAISSLFQIKNGSAADIALYINAISFLFCALTVYRLKDIPKGPKVKGENSSSVGRSLVEGWKFVSSSKVIRGLIFGMLGAFVAAGAVIGLARTFVGDLQAGEAAYGVLFGAVFTGLALGIGIGPKVFSQFSRRRLFGASLTTSGFFLLILALIQNLVLAVLIVLILGVFAGISWVTGFTMLGIEVSDEVRGRTFAFVQSLIRIILVLVLAVSPVVAASIGEHEYTIRHVTLNYNGAAFTMLLASIIAISVGVISYKQMKDRPGVSFLSDIKSALRGELGSITSPLTSGLFISFEGGEGSGKSTQTQLLKKWLEGKNRTVVLTREPGGTEIGVSLRKILLSKETGSISPRAEALMYAADRAHHVYSLIRPALERGDVVITDRYFDSSIAYQGAGRVLDANEIGRISRWATESLFPTLTIVLDQDPAIGLTRIKETDRLESEPIEFHQRIRQEFLDLAMQDPERYLVIDATKSIEDVHGIIVQKIENLIEK